MLDVPRPVLVALWALAALVAAIVIGARAYATSNDGVHLGHCTKLRSQHGTVEYACK